MLGSQANLNNATTMKTKKCSVCGDKAVGMNYNGLTCVSCRTFFTRSATKTGVLKCPKLNNCEIDLATRKSCPACRLKKSFAVGMRLKGRPNSTANSTSSSTEQSSSSTPQDTPDNSTDNSTDSSDSSALVACSPPQLSLSSSSPRSSQSTTSTNATNLDHLLHRNIASILSSLAIDNNPLIEHLYPETLHLNPLHRFAANRRRHFALDLNFREREIIAELQHAMNIAFVEEASLPEVRSTTDMVEVLSWPRIYSKRIVKFCKSIRVFKSLSEKDQLAIIKPFYYQLLVVRSVFMYDVYRNGYPVMEDESGQKAKFICLGDPGFGKGIKKWPQIKVENGNFFVRLQAEMANDPTLRDLIIGQFFYQPRPGISCPEYIRQQYFLYTYILRRYLEHKYKNLNLATRKFNSLMVLMSSLDATIEKSKAVFEVINVSNFDELLLELWGFV